MPNKDNYINTANMRTPSTPTRTTFESSVGSESPPSVDVWSTQRRLLEKPPPAAPCKPRSRGTTRRYSVDEEFDDHHHHRPASSKKLRTERLLLPSRTIDEDEDGNDDNAGRVALSFRPSTRRLFHDGEEGRVIQQSTTEDPTTVLLVPCPPPSSVMGPSSFFWHPNRPDDDDNEEEEQDFTMSPRLFCFGSRNLSHFDSVLAEDDESDEIFRQRGEEDDAIQRRFSWTSTMRGQDDGRD